MQKVIGVVILMMWSQFVTASWSPDIPLSTAVTYVDNYSAGFYPFAFYKAGFTYSDYEYFGLFYVLGQNTALSGGNVADCCGNKAV